MHKISSYIYVRKTNKMYLYLNNLFQLNSPLHVSNKYLFIIRRLFLYRQHTVFPMHVWRRDAWEILYVVCIELTS